MPRGIPAGSLWRHRDFMLLWSGQTVSLFGSQVSWLAVPLVAVVVLKASTFQVALLGALNALPPLLVSLPAGVLVDRHRKRRLMTACDIGSGLAMASIPLAGVLGHVTLAQLYLVSLVTGSLGALFDPAASSLTPRLLGSGRLAEANGRLNTARGLAEMGGPSAGGFLIGLFGAVRAVAVDSVSYGVSALALALMRHRDPLPEPGPAGRGFRDELTEGLRFVLAHPVLRPLSLTSAVTNVLLRGVSSIWLLYVLRDLHWSVRTAGLVYGLSLAGGVVGSMGARRLVDRIGTGRAITLGALLSAPFELVTPLVPTGPCGPWAVALVFTWLTAAGMVYGTASATVRQLACPPALLGRVAASGRFLRMGLVPLGPLLAGGLGTWIGLRATLLVLAGATLLCPLLLLATPLRDMREIPVHEAYARVAA
ncbi:MFS transporter [Streptomyces sp. SL13]|uniref:MFS transporter n=1 Tax=Streptantibioticus silvisoli TaxID=2705255 RepID=A0AA90KFH3_9ACTN|nr:MFS transporter [Streptantibioticus silvisoli]MDI5969270.1 MFS transporter [Streptantibioticus silvisoli]